MGEDFEYNIWLVFYLGGSAGAGIPSDCELEGASVQRGNHNGRVGDGNVLLYVILILHCG